MKRQLMYLNAILPKNTIDTIKKDIFDNKLKKTTDGIKDIYNQLDDIKSKYILQKIFYIMHKRKALQLIQYNKNSQEKEDDNKNSQEMEYDNKQNTYFIQYES